MRNSTGIKPALEVQKKVILPLKQQLSYELTKLFLYMKRSPSLKPDTRSAEVYKVDKMMLISRTILYGICHSSSEGNGTKIGTALNIPYTKDVNK